MPVLNLKQMKLNEPTRNFDESVDANVNISAENDQGQFGAFKFFTGIKAFFKGISALGTLASGSRLPVTDSNGNVTYTTMNDINNYVVNNALANYTKFTNRNTESITDANNLPEGFYVANNITNGLAGWTSYFTTKVDNNNNYKLQYAISNNGYMKFRRCNGGAWLDWEKLTTESDIKSVEYEVKPDTDITTGSVNGARFFQKEVLLNSLVSGLNVTRIKGVYIDYIYSSADYIPLPFVVGDKLYVNLYCARTNQAVRAVTQVIIKIIYI